MRMKIKRMAFDSFKGITHKEIAFDGNTKLIGQNGSFKTTTADGFFWVFADSNMALVKNPDVIPVGAEECNPTVEIECEIDGKPLAVCKKQKFKKKEVDGKVTSSVTNTYSINGIDKSYRDFVADLTERGFDMENFLVYSNPNSFLADTSKSGRDKIRKVLFKMAGEFTDLDIAKSIGASEIVTDMESKGLKLEEIKASSSASIKRIESENGKNNELIDAKISGLIEGKADISIEGLAERETNTKNTISELETKISDFKSGSGNDAKIKELQATIRAIEVKTKEEYYVNRNQYLKNKSDLVDKYREIEEVINKANKAMIEANHIVEADNALLENLRKEYGTEFNKKYENDGKCPHCGQDLPKEMIETAEQSFNERKNAKLEDIKGRADAINKELERLSDDIADAKETISRMTPSLEMIKDQIDELNSVDMNEPNISDIPEVVALQAEINDLTSQMNNSPNEALERLNEALRQAKDEQNQIAGMYGALENNKLIDERIAALREKKRTDEISKAELEKKLFQVSEVEKAKNEKLSESINSHFNIVKFKLFDFLKNGNYTETVEIMIDDKPMSSCANGSLIQLCKLDCLAGLQGFFNQYIPVWLDDAALITTNTSDRIKVDSQLIQLIAKDGVTELTIEKGV